MSEHYHYGTTIKKYREHKGWSQLYLAEHWPKTGGDTGVDYHYVQLVEYGKRKLADVYVLRRLCRLLEIPPWEFGLSEHDPFNTTLVPGTGKPLHDETLNVRERTEDEDMDKKRRQMLQQGIELAGAATLIPAMHHQSLIANVKRVLHRSLSAPEEKDLRYMERKIKYYWQDRWNAAIAHADLIPHLIDFVRDVTVLLNGSLFPAVRTRLCASLSQGMLLIGVCFYDIGQFQAAKMYCQTAAEAASEANNNILQALAWGWVSLSWTYSNETNRYECALKSMLQACNFAALESDRAVQCWTQAGLAEVYAHLNNKDACLQALDRASKPDGYSTGNFYYIHLFDRSLLGGYRGVCLQQFYQSDVPDTRFLLEEAKQALQGALSLSSIPLLRKGFYLADIAHVHARKGEIEPACNYAKQIIEIVDTSQSITLRQRLLTLRTRLEPYKNVADVKTLELQMKPLLATIWR